MYTMMNNIQYLYYKHNAIRRSPSPPQRPKKNENRVSMNYAIIMVGIVYPTTTILCIGAATISTRKIDVCVCV